MQIKRVDIQREWEHGEDKGHGKIAMRYPLADLCALVVH
jgi:hypothetical protein